MPTLNPDPAEMKDCPFCHERIRAVAIKCRYCDTYLDGRDSDAENSPSTVDRMLLPVGRPASAILSGYLALFGIIPLFGLPFSVGGLISGLIALKAIKKNPDLSGAGRAWFGIVLGGLMTVVSLIILAVVVAAGLNQQLGR